MKQKYDVAAYVWPAYTGDEPRTKIFWEEGIGEWQSVKNSVQKFEGHNWPRKPLWGYVNEADPEVMEMEIEEATNHGVNVFIYDWYWYDGRPFLENCLNDGFLKANNNKKMKFYIMWANHDVNYTWDIRHSEDQETVIWKGAVDRKEFEVIANRLIEKYFTHPLYYRIDNKPVFQIYDIHNIIKGLGGIENTKEAFAWLQNRCKECGLDGVHLQLTVCNGVHVNLSGVDTALDSIPNDVVETLGFDSVTHYQYCHFVDIDRDYREIMVDVLKEWGKLKQKYSVKYFPHISIGWDNNPRYKNFRGGVVKNNTPEVIKEAFQKAKEYMDNHPDQVPLMTINSWNEWTETSYLMPDDLYGYGYLEAVRDVFMKETSV